MKSEEIRLRYVELRAEGQSYAAIAAELHISKSTCTAWEKELAAEITRLRQEKLNALYEEYAMHKEARIKRLGSTLDKIEEAIDAADLGSVAPEKLLELKLKYAEALKKEYTGAEPPLQLTAEGSPPAAILAALQDLHNRIRAGEVTPEQANLETRVLTGLLTAYDSTETKRRLDALSSLLGARNLIGEE